MVAEGALRLNEPMYGDDGKTLFFLEGRPTEAGRQVLVRRSEGGALEDVTPKSVNIRTLVHEYGGGSYALSDGLIFYSNYSDQRCYVQLQSETGEKSIALPISPAGSAPKNFRFADYCIDAKRERVICVLEDREGLEKHGEPANKICAFSYKHAKLALAAHAAGDDSLVAQWANNEPTLQILVEGSDFYAFPRLDKNGSRLAYIRWNHPNLPWDDSQLICSKLADDGTLHDEEIVAGGQDCSVFQPQWAHDGTLYYVSDQGGHWNLFALEKGARHGHNIVPEAFRQYEFGLPLWVFNMSTYAVVDDVTIICAVNRRGLWFLARLTKQEIEAEPGDSHFTLSEIVSPYTDLSSLHTGHNGGAGCNFVAMEAAAANLSSAVVEYDWRSDKFELVRAEAEEIPSVGFLSRPEVIEFPTEDDKTAFAFFYPPTNELRNAELSSHEGGTLPPLIVKCHGGPTGAASSSLSLGVQFWTSRGFAVVDVNYGGSTGFGRDYRKRLNNGWGLVDVDDCVNVVKYLAAQKRIDGDKVAITGGSAGGYTVLCALTFKDVFRAGASHYGIGDLEALVRDTHKFEARYLDNLVGRYPEDIEIYKKRSPINHVDGLDCPVIFFQGLEDKVVPPNQAEAMVAALDAKGVPVAYIAYEGEQHGFRQAANIIRTLESELYFYRRVFGIESEEALAPVAIRNLS
jgi:dipeptidyl aminopeptidase/acylaminoacyl peptidase